MSELSTQAQAVLDAVITDNQTGPERFHARAYAAAALRAGADQVLPLYMCSLGSTRGTTRLGVRQKLIAIAAELEGAQ